MLDTYVRSFPPFVLVGKVRSFGQTQHVVTSSVWI